MSILNDVYTAFSSLNIHTLNNVTTLKKENAITKEWSKEINKLGTSTKSAIEVPNYAQFCGLESGCTAGNILVRCYPKFISDSSMPTYIDMTCMGVDQGNIPEYWLIESKFLGEPRPSLKFGMAYCASMTGKKPNPQLHPDLVNTISSKSYLTDSYDGVVWADICRLLEVNRYFKKSSPKPKLFQAYYIRKDHTNFASKLVDIYNEYWSAIGNAKYGEYAITEGFSCNGQKEWHAWKIHALKAVNFYAQPNASPVCLIPPCQPPIAPTPFCSDKSGQFDLFLIEIVP